MTFVVLYTPQVQAQIAEQIDWLRDQGVSESTIAAWFERLFDRTDALAEIPYRNPVDDVESALAGCSVRRMVFETHLVFYVIDESRRLVSLVSFITGANRPPFDSND